MPNSIDYKDNEETASERTSRLKYLSVWEYAKGETKPIWTDNAFAGNSEIILFKIHLSRVGIFQKQSIVFNRQ